MDSNAYCDYAPELSRIARACHDAVSFLPEQMRPDAYRKYYQGYRTWLAAGLPEISGTQLRAAANSAPDVEFGIVCHTNGMFDPANIIGMKTDI